MQGKLNSARLKRAAKRRITRARRALVWNQLRRQAARHGYTAKDLERFYHYLSTNFGLEAPRHTDPLQQPRNHFPGLGSKAVHDTSDFPWAAALASNFETIRQELFEYTSNSDLDRHPQDLTDRGGWNVLYFHAGGRPVEATLHSCPRTSAMIASFPGAGQAGQAYLSVLRPDTHIQRHFGPTNTRLRCHFGIAVPDGARIRVGDKICNWQEGRSLVFDDSFDHEVWNDSQRERVVLIVDFWHPELTPAERWAIAAARELRFGLRDILHT